MSFARVVSSHDVVTTRYRPLVVDAPAFALPEPASVVLDESLVRQAGHVARSLPAAVHDALVDFADSPDPSGALLLRGLLVGDLPPTPDDPTAPTGKPLVSELMLLTAARRLGQPVGYEPEHGGEIVQNIVPTRAAAERQVSTSSKVELAFHTEAAFHPHRPRYLLLLCLRGDPAAATTLASVNEVLPHLPDEVRAALFEPRFRTAVDESYLHGRSNVLGDAMAVLTGDPARPSMVFDADLMVGTDTDADRALQVLAEAVAEFRTAVVLDAGDLLVVDNTIAVHGRSPFTPRFDGTDRWLQRTFVVSDLAASAADRVGRVITTRFGA
jgi:L-asparagine oxygenase